MEEFKKWCEENRVSPEAAILSPMWIDRWKQHVFDTMSQVKASDNPYSRQLNQRLP